MGWPPARPAAAQSSHALPLQALLPPRDRRAADTYRARDLGLGEFAWAEQPPGREATLLHLPARQARRLPHHDGTSQRSDSCPCYPTLVKHIRACYELKSATPQGGYSQTRRLSRLRADYRRWAIRPRSPVHSQGEAPSRERALRRGTLTTNTAPRIHNR